MIELRHSSLSYDYIKQLPVEYEGQLLGYQDVRLILVEDKVLLATFALRQTEDTVAEQLKAHLRRMGLKLGLLANFYGTRLAITPVRIK
jgi:GxxExxY protein